MARAKAVRPDNSAILNIIKVMAPGFEHGLIREQAIIEAADGRARLKMTLYKGTKKAAYFAVDPSGNNTHIVVREDWADNHKEVIEAIVEEVTKRLDDIGRTTETLFAFGEVKTGELDSGKPCTKVWITARTAGEDRLQAGYALLFLAIANTWADLLGKSSKHHPYFAAVLGV